MSKKAHIPAYYSAEAEKAVLGSMIARPDDVMDVVRERVTDRDFFVPAHKILFKTFCDMQDGMRAIDLTTVQEYLADRKLDKVVGAPGILSELASGLASHLNVMSYVQMVKDKAILRSVQNACADIVQRIADNPDPATEILDHAQGVMCEISMSESKADTEQAQNELSRSTMAQIRALSAQATPQIGIPSGFKNLDEVVGGFGKGELIIVAARTGKGKSVIAGNMMTRMAQCKILANGEAQYPGYGAGFFSLEMNSGQVQRRSLASLSEISATAIRRGKLLEHQLETLGKISEEMATWNLHYDDSPIMTINSIRAKSRKWVKRHGVEIIFVDYLQLIQSTGNGWNRAEAVAEISRGLKCLAKELQIPVVALAQLNRNADSDEPPQLRDLRESGAIEQDADIILFLHTTAEKKDDGQTSRMPYKVYVAKQRDGATRPVDMIFYPGIVKFITPEEEKAMIEARRKAA